MDIKRKQIDYKWVIAGICFLMVLTVLGFCSSSRSVYFSAITEALGISRSTFSISDSVRFITTAIVNLFFWYFNCTIWCKEIDCSRLYILDNIMHYKFYQ